MVARVLRADASARACGDLGPAGAGSAAELLREQAAAGEVLTRMAQARSLRAVAGLVERASGGGHRPRRFGGGRVGEFVADQVAAVLGVSRRTAELRIEDALALTHRLPRTLTALEVGLVSMPVARVLVRETENTTPAVAAEVEARVLDRLGRGIVPGLGRLSVDELGLLGRLDPDLVARGRGPGDRGRGAVAGPAGAGRVGR